MLSIARTNNRRHGVRLAVAGAAVAFAATLAGADLVSAGATADPGLRVDRDVDQNAKPPIAAFTVRKGRLTTFDAPGAELETVAAGINNRGHIVGTYVDGGRTAHGFLRRAGRYTTFDAPGVSGTDASAFLNYPGTDALDVNDRGQTVGAYTGPGGTA